MMTSKFSDCESKPTAGTTTHDLFDYTQLHPSHINPHTPREQQAEERKIHPLLFQQPEQKIGVGNSTRQQTIQKLLVSFD